MIAVTVAARSDGVDQIRSIRCCCMRPLLRMPAITKQKARMCARRGQERRQTDRSRRHAARGMFHGPEFPDASDLQGLLPCPLRQWIRAAENGQDVTSFYFCSGEEEDRHRRSTRFC
ncbi:hypothetical protein GQ55_1G397500 [Panicum hallii var. hallii]|uniref:Uncharacterized protein n=1 Tax=Panicum hallii var. hallii TaxID=1504633 RepID=A0A2T7FCC3_9POAL|nr:hypothetical protein GQ55_1G397500 [Panicum hallii var. hallii]